MPQKNINNYINDSTEVTAYNSNDFVLVRQADNTMKKVQIGSIIAGRTSNNRIRTIGRNNCYYTITDNAATNATVLNTAMTELYALGGGTLIGDNNEIVVSSTIVVRSDSSVSVNLKNISIKLANTSNVDLVKSYSFDTQTGSNNASIGYSHFYWSNVMLNGNRANNTVGTTFRRYGYAGYFENVTIIEGAQYNVYSEWAVGAEATAPDQDHNGMEDVWVSPRIYNAGDTNVVWRGPHDSIWVAPILFADGDITTTTEHNLVVEASSTYAAGPLFIVGGHIWGKTQDDSVITRTTDPANSAKLVGECDIEGAVTTGTYAVRLLTGGNNLKGHAYFSANGLYVEGNHQSLDMKISAIQAGGTALKIGSDTTAVSASKLTFEIENSAGATTLDYANASSANNMLDVVGYQGTGTDYFNGTINNINNGQQNRILISGSGGTVSIMTTGETLRVRDNKVTVVGNNAEQMKVYSTAVTGDIMNVNASADPAFQFPNQTKLEGFSDNYATLQWRISTWNGKAEFKNMNLSNLPTSASGLSAGDIWQDGSGHLRIA